MEYKSDLDMALRALKDEVEGVKEYGKMVEYCENPELKSIATKIRNDEKQHATLIMQWVSKNIQGQLG